MATTRKNRQAINHDSQNKAVSNQWGALSRVATRTATVETPEWGDEKLVFSIFGLTHTPLFNLRKAGKIRSVSTRGAGQSHGKRLFHLQSIRDFFADQERMEMATANGSEESL